MSTAVAERDQQARAIERVLIQGDLKDLNPEQRVQYLNRVCESLGLNPLTQPFAFINLSGKLTLYARRDCTEQLRKRDRVGVSIQSREIVGGVYVVTARATLPDGRCDESIGAVPIEGIKGEALANAMMKAETKAKRRVTLSICGLGMLDEAEAETLPGARVEQQSQQPQQQLPAARSDEPPPEHGDAYEPERQEPDRKRQFRSERVLKALANVKVNWIDPKARERLTELVAPNPLPQFAGDLADSDVDKIIAYCADVAAKRATKKANGGSAA